MIPFIERFPELGARETRLVSVPEGTSLPAGEYGFLEFYCDEPGCDCRRVIIRVLRPESGWSDPWATISYGWERPEFYQAWGVPDECDGPFLDPLNPQTVHSTALLDLFRYLIQSPNYVERLRSHYRMFRESVERRTDPAAIQDRVSTARRKSRRVGKRNRG